MSTRRHAILPASHAEPPTRNVFSSTCIDFRNALVHFSMGRHSDLSRRQRRFMKAAQLRSDPNPPNA